MVKHFVEIAVIGRYDHDPVLVVQRVKRGDIDDARKVREDTPKCISLVYKTLEDVATLVRQDLVLEVIVAGKETGDPIDVRKASEARDAFPDLELKNTSCSFPVVVAAMAWRKPSGVKYPATE